MTRIGGSVFVLMAAGLCLAQAATAQTADPLAEARAAFQRYDEGWRRFDAAAVDGAFAPEFEWTNSVGIRVTDHARLKRFLDGLFKQSNYNVATSGPLDIRSIRQIAPDVVVISCREVTHGQIHDKTGKVSPDFGTNELAVLRREGGRWLIVYDLDSDETHGI
jgi:hypothetical protein